MIEKYAINKVVFEDIQLQGNVTNNVQTFKILAEVFGVIYELVTELEIEHAAVLSSSWKSTLGIKGRTRSQNQLTCALLSLQKEDLQMNKNSNIFQATRESESD